PRLLQPADLVAAQAGDPAQVVVGLAAGLALVDPAAHVAVGRGQRVADRRLGQGGEEAGLGGAVVGGDVGQADGLAVARAEDDVDALGCDALDALHLLGVVAQLQDSAGLHVAGQLGVLGLVAVGTEGAGPGDLGEEVGVAPPGDVAG